MILSVTKVGRIQFNYIDTKVDIVAMDVYTREFFYTSTRNQSAVIRSKIEMVR